MLDGRIRLNSALRHVMEQCRTCEIGLEKSREDEALAALARGFARFVAFLGASKPDARAIREPLLRQRVASSQRAM
jgi:hypothetical protein